jgi:hypothetical protein
MLRFFFTNCIKQIRSVTHVGNSRPIFLKLNEIFGLVPNLKNQTTNLKYFQLQTFIMQTLKYFQFKGLTVQSLNIFSLKVLLRKAEIYLIGNLYYENLQYF